MCIAGYFLKFSFNFKTEIIPLLSPTKSQHFLTIMAHMALIVTPEINIMSLIRIRYYLKGAYFAQYLVFLTYLMVQKRAQILYETRELYERGKKRKDLTSMPALLMFHIYMRRPYIMIPSNELVLHCIYFSKSSILIP